MKIFAVLQFSAKKYPAKPTRPVGTIFAGQNLVFSIYFSFTAKLQKQKQKTKQIIDRVALESFAVSFAVALQWLCSFMHFTIKYVITKHRPISQSVGTIFAVVRSPKCCENLASENRLHLLSLCSSPLPFSCKTFAVVYSIASRNSLQLQKLFSCELFAVVSCS